MRWAIFAVLPWAGCIFTPPGELDCESVAMLDAEGNVDECDLAACQACSDACGTDCVILESYPPQYACDADSWTVYDQCPDWEPPNTP